MESAHKRPMSNMLISGQTRTGTLGALSRSFRTCKTGLSLIYSKVPQVISTLHVRSTVPSSALDSSQFVDNYVFNFFTTNLPLAVLCWYQLF